MQWNEKAHQMDETLDTRLTMMTLKSSINNVIKWNENAGNDVDYQYWFS